MTTIGGVSLLEAYGCSRLKVAKAYVLGQLKDDRFVWDVISQTDVAAAKAAIELERADELKVKEASPGRDRLDYALEAINESAILSAKGDAVAANDRLRIGLRQVISHLRKEPIE